MSFRPKNRFKKVPKYWGFFVELLSFFFCIFQNVKRKILLSRQFSNGIKAKIRKVWLFIIRPIVAKIISVSSPARCQHWLSTSSPKVFKNQQTASTLLTHQTLKCCTLQNQASFFIQFSHTSIHLAFQSVFFLLPKLQQQLATIQLQSCTKFDKLKWSDSSSKLKVPLSPLSLSKEKKELWAWVRSIELFWAY